MSCCASNFNQDVASKPVDTAARRVYVNLETKEKMYTSGEHMCPADGWVCFRNSQLLCGRLGKATLGGGNKAGLYQVTTRSRCLYL